jgi:hypothetical protein
MPTGPDVFIVGGGLAGLCCARTLREKGVRFQILEASDQIGGRVRTDEVDGYLLDRGFQVLLTAYPEARRLLDYGRLELKSFAPGTISWHAGRRDKFVDPWRIPRDCGRKCCDPNLARSETSCASHACEGDCSRVRSKRFSEGRIARAPRRGIRAGGSVPVGGQGQGLMWNRACPLCFQRVPGSLVLTRGEDLRCPSCRAPLELSRASRVLGAICGLLLAMVAVGLIVDSRVKGRWVWTVVAAVLAYGVGSTVVLYFLADVRCQCSPEAFSTSAKLTDPPYY